MKYPVNDLYPCIQGEGCQTGLAMIMLRLHGCPVGCPWCDTKETWHLDQNTQRKYLSDALGANPFWCELDAKDIANAIDKLGYREVRWVLISGGEPALYNLAPLVEELHSRAYKCAIETSGTAIGHVGAGFEWITISPKIGMPGGFALKARAFEGASEVKYPIGKKEDLERLNDLIRMGYIQNGATICVQPISASPTATRLCEEAVQTKGWRLSVQVHKLLQLR